MPADADFLIQRKNLQSTEWCDTAPSPSLREGEATLRVDRFAITANNITYAIFGEKMRYWDFFPAPEGYGRMPVWGFAEVVESRADGLAVGERLYGYLPISPTLTVQVGEFSRSAFTDISPWRSGLAGAYNRYLRVTDSPAFAGETAETMQAVFRPLFATSFLLDDFLADEDYFGAELVLVSSASSKTALTLGQLLRCSARRPLEVVGLTSETNAAFVEGTGYFDRVVRYDQIDALERRPAVFVDMAGSASVRAAVHHRFEDDLRYSCAVGNSHWQDPGRASGLAGPRPLVFFAPGHGAKKVAAWGVDGYEARLLAAWEPFSASAREWMEVERYRGRVAIEALYRSVLDGKLAPRVAAIASMEG